MQYIDDLKNYYNEKRTAVTLGKFDGFHRGHDVLLKNVIACAENDPQVESVVCSIDMIPFFKELGKDHKVLMNKKDKIIRLSDCVDYYVNCPFIQSFREMSAEEFIKHVLVDLFHAKYVVVGVDFCFGYQKSGNVQVLADFQKKYDYKLIVIDQECHNDRKISSTYIRQALHDGDIELANILLGYNYTITGEVEHGKKLGRKLGFPTMNVVPEPNKLMPPNGVYMMKVFVDGSWYPAIGNIGVKPTVSEEERLLVECFLLKYSGDAYGKEVHVELLEYRRPEQKFKDLDEMKRVVNADIDYGREYFQKFIEK